jgi:hypothetical protein
MGRAGLSFVAIEASRLRQRVLDSFAGGRYHEEGRIFKEAAMKRKMLLVALCGLLLVVAGRGQRAEQATLPLVSYADLGKEVRALKGKVVVVYFWADY